MLTLKLPDDVEDRLDLLSLKTGHTRQFYVLEAVLEYLDEMEARVARYEGIGEGEPTNEGKEA